MIKESVKANTVTSVATEKIILAAEVEFSERGFEGAGMKAISARAEVAQSLLHYHFGNKDKLYAAVIAQRSKKINKERLALLKQIDLQAENALDRILEALFRPPLGPAGGDGAYARIFTGLVVGQEREQALVQEHYDPTARQFIAALERTVPGMTQAKAAMGYTLALGALIAVIGRDGRVERLMGRHSLQSFEEILGQLVLFTKGGVLALASPR